ncbi:MAG: 16S rRNA (cytidine(1402)-2'-O)-methyltransferase [Candidatus Ryanbacteria bacterium CG10_big_fil_rev_8_21_14_0_10_43_42]|uniref:Ribosomal RNA small subunit methyltransferase I n=1 Tax=Candidatus Ryanbacteria bacterium CG10_big_fil_rev_8_21_14_0_10_43_42 TaxID=1974864 RepID=A0A2M8KXH3_9BACT|nr:MAG: 16S rRNA (cytidine(1402)-2'-O)-methyltransferase [Candidatus Ryanbacteria bacterium CG10_big_fil_rev_8_21_14_0_10_43_42]
MKYNNGILYIVATPIGNLEDITLRALRILKEADNVYAEDTRVTKKLLAHYDIKTFVKRYDEHVADRMHNAIGQVLKEGQTIALVSDAGTPGISDPGARLVAYLHNHMPDVVVVPIPGPSALVTALSIAGVSGDQFTFLGYPPHKKGRKTFFEKIPIIETRPVVLYESPHRVERTLAALSENLGNGHHIVIARELTKMYEDIYRGTIERAQVYITGERKKGEFVIIVF